MNMKAAKAPGISRGASPQTVPAADRVLTLQDLGEEEKAKVQRLVEKLVGLSREHEEVVSALSTERARHAEEIDTANRRLEEELYSHESKLREQSASMVNLQEQRSEALRLLHVYQARIEQMHQALQEQQERQLEASKELEARKDTCSRLPLLEASVAQLEQLVDSQKKSIESLERTSKNSLESHKAQLLLLEKRHQEALERVANQQELVGKANSRCLGLETACSGLTKQITSLNKGSKEKDEQIGELQLALQKIKDELAATPSQPSSSSSPSPIPPAAIAIPAPSALSSSSSSSSYNGGGMETAHQISEEAKGAAAARTSSLPSPLSSMDNSPARSKGQMRSGLNEVHQEVLRQQIQHQKYATQIQHEKNVLRHTKSSSPPSPPHLHQSRSVDEHIVAEERNGIQKKKKKLTKRIVEQQKLSAASTAAPSSSTLPLHTPKHVPLSQSSDYAPANVISSPKKKTSSTNNSSTSRAKNGVLEVELGQRRNYDDALLELLSSIET